MLNKYCSSMFRYVVFAIIIIITIKIITIMMIIIIKTAWVRTNYSWWRKGEEREVEGIVFDENNVKVNNIFCCCCRLPVFRRAYS